MPPFQLAFAGPVTEELIFRGCVLSITTTAIKTLYPRISGHPLTSREAALLTQLAIAGSAIDFSYSHVASGCPIQLLYAFIFALRAGAVYPDAPLQALADHSAYNLFDTLVNALDH